MTEAKREETRHRGLGRGLSALIGDEAPIAASDDHPGRNLRWLPVAFLRPNPFQPRKHFDQKELEELAKSIRLRGLLQPILVRAAKGQPDNFEIVAGERRWRAAQLAQLHDVPVVVRNLDDGESLELAIMENVQRSDLNPIEEATAYRQLMDRFGYTQERLADDIGKSRSHVANMLRLVHLPEAVQAMIREGKLSAGHARTLIGSLNPEALAKEILRRELNVREAEQRSRDKGSKGKKPHTKDADTKSLESNLSNMLGLKVEILHKGSTGGEVKIHYRSLEQLDDLIRRLNSRR